MHTSHASAPPPLVRGGHFVRWLCLLAGLYLRRPGPPAGMGRPAATGPRARSAPVIPIVATGSPSRAPQVVAPARPRVTTSDLGSPLTAAREAHGKTLAEIADTTKIPARVLAALERDDVSQLPDGIFARGVVRAYAREVGLAPDPLLAALVARRPSVAVPPWSAPDIGGELARVPDAYGGQDRAGGDRGRGGRGRVGDLVGDILKASPRATLAVDHASGGHPEDAPFVTVTGNCVILAWSCSGPAAPSPAAAARTCTAARTRSSAPGRAPGWRRRSGSTPGTG